MHDDLSTYLEALDSGSSYRVDAILKETPSETTERVFLIDASGMEHGPFIRKRIIESPGMGRVYECLWNLQQSGKRHVHLPRIYACSHDEHALTVIMEHVAGDTLADYVEACGGSVELVRVVFPLICEAASELHEAMDPPIIHRDIKPGNIIISPNNVTLIDFGIARTFDSDAEHDTAFLGTRGYAPPEQFGYGQTSTRSDVYALGMVLRYCLTGEQAGRAESDWHCDREIPEQLQAVLAKATSFDPKARYSSARELEEALKDAIEVERDIACDDVPPAAPDESQRISIPPPTQHAGSPKTRKPRIPVALGIAWDVVVVLAWILFIIAAAYAAIYPTGDTTQATPAVRWVISMGMIAVPVTLVAFLLLDRRLLRRHVTFLRNATWKRELLICLLAALISVFTSFVLAFLLVALGL